MSERPLAYTIFESPVGALLLAGDGEALHLIGFPTGSRAKQPDPAWRKDAAPFKETVRQLGAYFAGDRRAFDLPLHFGGTDFQNTVWRTLIDIPYGETITYADLAARIGRPTASRAVGAANGANPLPIVAPCHRVIGANGSLTGFGGGLPTKMFLLRHEGVAVEERQLALAL